MTHRPAQSGDDSKHRLRRRKISTKFAGCPIYLTTTVPCLLTSQKSKKEKYRNHQNSLVLNSTPRSRGSKLKNLGHPFNSYPLPEKSAQGGNRQPKRQASFFIGRKDPEPTCHSPDPEAIYVISGVIGQCEHSSCPSPTAQAPSHALGGLPTSK